MKKFNNFQKKNGKIIGNNKTNGEERQKLNEWIMSQMGLFIVGKMMIRNGAK